MLGTRFMQSLCRLFNGRIITITLAEITHPPLHHKRPACQCLFNDFNIGIETDLRPAFFPCRKHLINRIKQIFLTMSSKHKVVAIVETFHLFLQFLHVRIRDRRTIDIQLRLFLIVRNLHIDPRLLRNVGKARLNVGILLQQLHIEITHKAAKESRSPRRNLQIVQNNRHIDALAGRTKVLHRSTVHRPVLYPLVKLKKIIQRRIHRTCHDHNESSTVRCAILRTSFEAVSSSSTTQYS